MPLGLKPLHPRDPEARHRAATQLELLFDLVTVIAIASVTAAFHHAVSQAHGLEKLPNFIFLYIAIWWAWMNHAWFASAFDNDDPLYRVLTIVIMLGALIFAGSVSHIFETLDFGIGVWGWVIMRIGMVGLWLRAAEGSPKYRRTAHRYAAGIFIAQACWVVLYFSVAPTSAAFIPIGILIFLIEFSVPVIAERAEMTPWHRHHIIERYGLLNIIVLGEVLLSVSFFFSHAYEHGHSTELVVTAVSGLVLAFVLWWLYFAESEHLDSTEFGRVFIWGYGHVFIFAAGALLATGIGAYFDIETAHAAVGPGIASAWVNGSVALYILALYLIRDRFLGRGWRNHVLLVGGAIFVAAAITGTAPWLSALLGVAVLAVRTGGSTVGQVADKEHVAGG